MNRPGCIVYSDLDGTFLDAVDYSWGESLPVLRRALRCGARIVFCSSKSGAEIRQLLRRLDLASPFIAENGGGIFIPDGYFRAGLSHLPLDGPWRILSLGTPYSDLVAALREVRRELGGALHGFSDMSAEEVAQLCGFSREEALLAMQRHFDEPFVLEQEEHDLVGRMKAAFGSRGLQLTRGGRFFHLMGANDKGVAVRRLNGLFREECGEICTLGFGDSANDLPMLEAVDHPVLVRKPGGTYDESVAAGLANLIRAPGVGPAGWARVLADFVTRWERRSGAPE